MTSRPACQLALVLAPADSAESLESLAVGTAIGPTAVCYFGLLERLAPRGTLTQAFTASNVLGLG